MARGCGQQRAWAQALTIALALILLLSLCLLAGHSLSHLGHPPADSHPIAADCALCAQLSRWQRLMDGLLPWLMLAGLCLLSLTGPRHRPLAGLRRVCPLSLIELQVKLTI